MLRRLCLCLVAGTVVLAAAGAAQAAPRPGADGAFHRAVCRALPGDMHCMALEVTNSKGQPYVTKDLPSGYGPSQLQSAYNLTSASATDGGQRDVVAIIDAYNQPYIVSNLATYRSTYGLPKTDGLNGDPIFKVVNQSGGSSLPVTDSGWGDEESLDVDMVSSICPRCSILLVEANSPSDANLFTAEKFAQHLAPVVAVSNSWGGSEFSQETTADQFLGIKATTAATGDSGYGDSYPATSPKVTAVGGTTLTESGSTWSETAWSGGGSGCSTIEPQPSYQSSFPGFPTGCAHRAEADVSAVADPNTGVAVYDTCGDLLSLFEQPAPCYGSGGWEVFGGTSVATPIVASIFALANNGGTPATPYTNYTASGGADFHDITSGSNGSCSPTWLCNAGPGYDGPTGLGSPNGIGGF